MLREVKQDLHCLRRKLRAGVDMARTKLLKSRRSSESSPVHFKHCEAASLKSRE